MKKNKSKFSIILIVLLFIPLILIFSGCERPDSVLRRRATELAGLGKIDESALLYKRLVETTKDEDDLISILTEAGDVMKVFGRNETALYYFGEVIKKSPLSNAAFHAHSARAQIFMEKNEPEGAIEEYWTLIKRFPHHKKIDYYKALLSEAELSTGEIANAISTANLVKNSQDKDASEIALFVYAEAMFLSKRWVEAVSAYHEYMERFPNSPVNPEIICRISSVFQARGEIGSAKSILLSYMKNHGKNDVVERCLNTMMSIYKEKK